MGIEVSFLGKGAVAPPVAMRVSSFDQMPKPPFSMILQSIGNPKGAAEGSAFSSLCMSDSLDECRTVATSFGLSSMPRFRQAPSIWLNLLTKRGLRLLGGCSALAVHMHFTWLQ
jgi:hypothetical protein